MVSPEKNIERKSTTVAIFATYRLVADLLRTILQDSREISEIKVAVTQSELLQLISKNSPHVVLLCLMENEGTNVGVITDLLAINPEIKVVILSTPDSLLDQPVSLRLGASGILGTDQNARVLIRAIEQVSRGGVWLNQKLIKQLVSARLGTENGKPNPNGLTGVDALTERELEVVTLVGRGMNNKEVAKNLGISEATVRHHLSSIYGKLGVEDRLNLAIYAYQYGIVQPQTKSM